MIDMNSKCTWTGSGNKSCKRHAYSGSEYCLFHKPGKNREEAELFWKVINFRVFPENTEKFLPGLHIDPGVPKLLSDEMTRVISSNFSEHETQRPDFGIYEKTVTDLYFNESLITGKSSPPDIVGFIFPSIGVGFDYQYNPSSPIFYQLNFTDCVFEGPAIFSGFNFKGYVTFKNTEFKSYVLFNNAVFSKKCVFVDTDLNTTHGVIGIGMFDGCKFRGEEVLFRNVKGSPSFGAAEFSQWTKLTLDRMSYPKDASRASSGENAYRIAKKRSNEIGDYTKAGDYYYLERVYKRFAIENRILRFVDWIIFMTNGYGEKPARVILSSIAVILLFSFVYLVEVDANFLESIYYSAVTFTTLGAKMPDATSIIMKISLAIESFLGGLFVALFVLTIAKRYSRG